MYDEAAVFFALFVAQHLNFSRKKFTVHTFVVDAEFVKNDDGQWTARASYVGADEPTGWSILPLDFGEDGTTVAFAGGNADLIPNVKPPQYETWQEDIRASLDKASEWAEEVEVSSVGLIASVFENLCDDDQDIDIARLQIAFLKLGAKSGIENARYMIARVDKYLRGRIALKKTRWFDADGEWTSERPRVSPRAASAFKLATVGLRRAIWTADVLGGQHTFRDEIGDEQARLNEVDPDDACAQDSAPEPQRKRARVEE